MDFGAIFFISILVLIFGAITVGRWKLYEKAGKPGWAALVPGYNWYVWLQIIGKPVWWIVLLLIPVVGVLVWVAMMIEFVKAYGKYKLGEHAAGLLLGFYYLPKIGFDSKVKYLGPPEEHKKVPKKSQLREWGDALLFAGVAALIIRTFFIEAFMIPTSSMERTLMAGDFLFVSKFHYGSRMPMVPLSVPFVHNKIKVGNFIKPSYVDWIQLPYWRLPGLTKVKRNDIVVFNFPAHDEMDLNDGAGLVKEVSMKENYIKRCVGMPGDTLEVRNQQVYIDGKPAWNPPNMQYQYLVKTNGQSFNQQRMTELGFRRFNQAGNENPNANFIPAHYMNIDQNGAFAAFMPDSIAKILKDFGNVVKIDTITEKAGVFKKFQGVYPRKNNQNGQLFKFNIDWFGPIFIPKKGATIELTEKNLSLYWRVISAYEGHELKVENGQAFIDGEKADSYTFEMDYYWMMGDNRHNSQDSRVWGFVPENHVVGKPLFVFFSYESDFGVRWRRIGTKYVH